MRHWKKILIALFAATCITNITFAEENAAPKPEEVQAPAETDSKAEPISKDVNAPSELKADEIEYDMETQQAKATGKVNVEHKPEGKNEASHLEADEVEYNVDTQQAKATGNVYIQHQNENKDPSKLNADIVEYDLQSGIMTAAGNVLLRQGTARATGKRAMYNSNTQEAYLLDDVIAIRDNVRITCDRLLSNGAGHMQADGNVYGVQTIEPDTKYPDGDTRTFMGDHVDFYPDEKNHVVIPGGGLLTSSDGDFTADFMEGWLDDEYYFGTGNAHAISPPRDMEAGGDRMEYFGKDGGKAIITGNAWAVQENNTMRGNRLTVYLADDKNLTVKPTPAKPATGAPKVEEFEVFQREREAAASRPSAVESKTADVDSKSADNLKPADTESKSAEVEKKSDDTVKTGEKIFVDVDNEKNSGGKKE